MGIGAEAEWRETVRFWKSCGVTHLTLGTYSGRGHLRRIDGRTRRDEAEAADDGLGHGGTSAGRAGHFASTGTAVGDVSTFLTCSRMLSATHSAESSTPLSVLSNR